MPYRNIVVSMSVCAFVTLIALFIRIFSNNDIAHTFISSVSAGFVFLVSSAVFWYYIHRHDNQKNTVNTVIYDAVYAIILKYMILILMLGVCFKFLNLDNKVFILCFVMMIVLKKLLSFLSYKRSM